jgi:hypothetical protein
LLLEQPRSVGEIAEALPVSRPAVSQHLKVLAAASLVTAASEGTRRVYSADPVGLAELRAWADRLWTSAVETFAGFAATYEEEGMSTKQGLDPVVKSLRLAVPPAEAFAMFTERIGDWWPLATHSVAGDEALSVRVEPRPGGRIFEVTSDGREHEWGRIVTWEEDRRVEFTWRPGLSEAQETLVEVTFRGTPEGCEMILIHTGWEARGEIAAEVRDQYDSGWDLVLGSYTAGLT